MTSPDGYIINGVEHSKTDVVDTDDWNTDRMLIHSRSGDGWPVQIDIENQLSFWLTQDQATTLASCILRAVWRMPAGTEEFMEANK